MNLTGIINVYKEKGYTSHDVVAILRKTLHIKKIGHTGTLDPDAEGVLPVCIGKATKLADYIQAQEKVYVCKIILGKQTDTGDMTGTVIAEAAVHYDIPAIHKAVQHFSFENMGIYYQQPPMYSAVKISGQKLYDLARKGIEVERAARPVTIHNIAVTEFHPNENAFSIITTCSKGTYIRVLCEDIGKQLGTVATMDQLVRTRSGMFHIDNAHTLETIKTLARTEAIQNIVIPPYFVLTYEHIHVKPEFVPQILNGNQLPLSSFEHSDLVRKNHKYWVSHENTLIGLFVCTGDFIKPEVMFT